MGKEQIEANLEKLEPLVLNFQADKRYEYYQGIVRGDIRNVEKVQELSGDLYTAEERAEFGKMIAAKPQYDAEAMSRLRTAVAQYGVGEDRDGSVYKALSIQIMTEAPRQKQGALLEELYQKQVQRREGKTLTSRQRLKAVLYNKTDVYVQQWKLDYAAAESIKDTIDQMAPQEVKPDTLKGMRGWLREEVDAAALHVAQPAPHPTPAPETLNAAILGHEIQSNDGEDLIGEILQSKARRSIRKPDENELPWRIRDGERAAGVFGSDEQGKFLLDHYLTGKGDPMVIENWKEYMTAKNVHTSNIKYRKKLERILRNAAKKRMNWVVGQSEPLKWEGFIELGNGEGMIGYQYLHGTETFKIRGTISLKENVAGEKFWEFDAQYIWADTLNKNNKYITDIVKSAFAETITLGEATSYPVEIKWQSKSTLDANNINGEGKGWPFQDSSNGK